MGYRKFSNVKIYPPNSKPFGIPYTVWVERWWKWLLSIPQSNNPAVNVTETFPLENQPYSKVSFLCQTMDGRPVNPQRTVTLHTGYSLFMPIINWLSILGVDGTEETDLIQKAKGKIDSVGQLKVQIGEVSVENLEAFRFRSSTFEVWLPSRNILGLKEDTVRVLSDGYWIFLGPIYETVSVRTFGSCSSGLTRIGADYTIYAL